MTISQQPFPWWAPSKKGEDLLKDYRLNSLDNFRFIVKFHLSLEYAGQEFMSFRPLICGDKIYIPEIVFYGPVDPHRNDLTILKYIYGGIWIEEEKSFALHIEWWTERLKRYEQHKPVYEEDVSNHWVENCYFKVDPESGSWIPMSPTEKELEQVKLWAILSELGD